MEELEEHHIRERCDGGGEEPENKEWLCKACHDFEHARRAVVKSIAREKKRGQEIRLLVLEKRLKLLEELNTPEIIRGTGEYMSYWVEPTLRRIPPEVKKVKQQEVGLWKL